MSPALRFLLPVVFTAALLHGSACGQAPATPATPAPKPKPTPPPVLGAHGIKLIPQPGVAIPPADRAELTAGVAALGNEIDALRTALQARPDQLALLPDVMIFHKAVDWALRYDEFFDLKQVAIAKKFLEMGGQRANELRENRPSWISATGLIPRGYISKIDGSVQPYGMVIPEDWKPGEKAGRRLDFWCHGRGEKLTELDFINQRLTSKGEFTPPGALVLHLYGRYCNANKFAGEVDLFEALASAKRHYNIDENKLVIRGFSMGGAAVWQFGTHFAGMWAAVQPGAGFAETREFNKVYAEGRTAPTWWEEVLYRWYDATEYVANLSNTTTVAYSGEIDGQKQAADIMIRYARKDAGAAGPGSAGASPVGSGAPAGTAPTTRGANSAGSNHQPRSESSAGAPKTTGGAPALPGVAPGDGAPLAAEARVTGTAPDVEFYHVIGPQTPHKIKPEAKPEIEKLVAAAVAKHEALPEKVRLVTHSLIYSKQAFLEIHRMERQWELAELEVERHPDGLIVTKAENVKAFRAILPRNAFPVGSKPQLRVGAETFEIKLIPQEPDEWIVPVRKEGGRWVYGFSPERIKQFGKRPDLPGPIDHAFMSSFVFVRPTGKPLNDKVGGWVAGEFDHAIGFWRKVFRGEAPVKDDTAITEDDIFHSNLVLWGDPSSNAVLKRIMNLSEIPKGARPLTDQEKNEFGMSYVAPPASLRANLRWDAKQLVFAGQTYDAAHTVPVLVFPNPLNPAKYVVLNSGPTFREDALLNNSQQIPKLPDWAMIDVNTLPDGKWPGQVLDAGFFDEQWQAPKGK